MRHLQTVGLPGDAEGFGGLSCVNAGLLSAVGPLAIALLFVVVWSTCVPVMRWTDTGYSMKNVDLDTRFWFTLDLLLFELPFAVGLGLALIYRRVTSCWRGALAGAIVAACLSIPPLVVMGCLSAVVAQTQRSTEVMKDFVDVLALFPKEVAAGASCGVIVAAYVRRLLRRRQPD